MTHPRRYPLGVPFRSPITSADFSAWDLAIEECVDGVGGGTYSGAIVFTNATLTTTSSINTGGDITTTGIVTTNELDAVTVYITGLCSLIGGGLTCNVGIDTRSLLADRIVARTIGTQTIDTTSGTVLALDFTLHDTFEITLNSGGGGAAAAVLATTATLTDTSGTPELEVKPGSKITLLFKAGSAQTGGIGIDPAATVFPARFHGLTKADLVGPRTGAITGTGGENDWIRIDLVNVGTAATPKYDCTLTMGAG